MKGMIRAVTGALALAILVGLVSLPASAVTGMTFTVNSSGDGGDSNLSDGMCDDGTGHCTLRAAIEQANAGPGTDSITFSIGSGTQTITPSSALPTVTDPLIIDGTTQPGFAGSPIIELDGTNAGGDVNGLTVTAGNSTVKGLVINRFSRAAIDLLSEGTNVVIGNFLGTDVTGTVALGNEFGARLEISANNKVGGTSASARNLISGNTSSGVLIEANGNQVEGNLIGTDVGGNAALGNGGDGVAIFFGANNRIGGTAEGARNVISGNMFDGIGLADFGSNVTTGNEIQGNFIGTDSTGTVALPNTRAGVELDGAPSNIIGGTVAAARNLISGNGASGIFLSAGISGNGASDNLVQGNFIGTDVGGSAALGNGFDGVLILNAPGNIIGGTQVSARNVISGNHSHGIELTDFVGNATTGNQVQGNFIGTDVTGTAALGNSRTGVVIERARGNTIGGTSAGARNLISGNTSGSGVLIDNASENQVQGNFIGTDVSGSAPLGNGGGGVAILNAAGNNTIGGTSAGQSARVQPEEAVSPPPPAAPPSQAATSFARRYSASRRASSSAAASGSSSASSAASSGKSPRAFSSSSAGDEHEELAAGLQIELVALGEPLDERDDDSRDVHLGQVELLLQHQRQEQVERPLERVESGSSSRSSRGR